MNKFFICLFSICLYVSAHAQNNVGIGTPNPSPGAILDLTSTSQGFLAPRTKVGLILAPVSGMIIFDTDSQCYCIYNGSGWHNMCAPGGDWLITGNGGTNPTINFAGTTDANDFVLRSNNVEVLRATTAGAVGINTPAPAPTSILDITSTTRGVLFPAMTQAQRDAIVSPANGLVIYNTDIPVHQFWNGTCWVNVGQTVCSFVYTTNYLTPGHNTDCLLVSNFSSVSDTLAVNLVSGTASPVILTALGVPAGVIVSFSNNYLLPPQQSIMTFTALPSALPGTYTITVLASSGSTVQTLTYTLVVFGFALQITPPDTAVGTGNLVSGGYISQATVSIGNSSTCASNGGFAQLSATVNGVSIGTIGSDVSVNFTTTSLAIPGSTQMYLTSGCPPPGIYDIQVQAQIGVTSSYATYTLTVTGTTPVHVTTSQTDLNLSSLFPPGACAGADTVIIDAGVSICSSGTLVGGVPNPAITTGTMTGNVVIVNNGTITGGGGAGGADPTTITSSTCPTADGGAGGDAIDVGVGINSIKVINNGTISGGGGGGGAGAAMPGSSVGALCGFTLGNNFDGGGGGGGAGCPPGAGGASTCTPGAPGAATTGGGGGASNTSGGCGVSCFFGAINANSGSGGNGGAIGQAAPTSGQSGGAQNASVPGGISLGSVCGYGNAGPAGYTLNGGGCACGTLVNNGTVNGVTRP